MMIKIVWWIFVFIIFEAMFGYPLSLLVLDKIFKNKKQQKDEGYEPDVTIMVVAHNEEKVIGDKLNNLINLNYPKEKTEILVASDFSTDRTNEIVREFIQNHSDWSIRLYESIEHKGKTNAQNEAQELVKSEILVMTDANAMLDKDAIRELVYSFVSDEVVYVCGQLKYSNTENNKTANSEGIYWKMDLMCRNIESRFQTITAGNGAIYACRNKWYKKINPIRCHDGAFPVMAAMEKKRALYNKDAIAYEKAGEIETDEFKRKVRMNRNILECILPNAGVLNVFQHKWFSYFYFGHRTCRYLLWLSHLLVLVLNVFLLQEGAFWKFIFLMQILFYLIAIMGWKSGSKNRWIKMITYYCMTIVAQWHGVYNILTGKTKATWDKAESTR